jgi:hypothetical protein
VRHDASSPSPSPERRKPCRRPNLIHQHLAETRDNPDQPVPRPGGPLALLLGASDSLEAESRSARTWFSAEVYRTATRSFSQ